MASTDSPVDNSNTATDNSNNRTETNPSSNILDPSTGTSAMALTPSLSAQIRGAQDDPAVVDVSSDDTNATANMQEKPWQKMRRETIDNNPNFYKLQSALHDMFRVVKDDPRAGNS